MGDDGIAGDAPVLSHSRENEWGWIFGLLCQAPKEERLAFRIPFTVLYKNGAFPPTSAHQCYYTGKDGRITRAGSDRKAQWNQFAPFLSDGIHGKRDNPPVCTLRLAHGSGLEVEVLTMPELRAFLRGENLKSRAPDVHSLQQLVPGCAGTLLRCDVSNGAEPDAPFFKHIFTVWRVAAPVRGHPPVCVRSTAAR
eukprot:CAMPEP_0174922218 /NCGR_PEP_ID=MMETSP1355-20121228/5714_1 /TAXON_ID=464990 /ORGANISM="Hemiselmis tepida, Strain CCMP443" /LENGTH=194 /DNA_ID=CAMNT_0016167789 /DNA_START=104 /DNA_END=685 /DNA_ORIENTATION=-